MLQLRSADEFQPLPLGGFHSLRAHVRPALCQQLALFFREVRLVHGHHLQGRHELVWIGHRCLVKLLQQPTDPRLQLVGPLALLLQITKLDGNQLAHRRQVVRRDREYAGNLVQ